MIKIILPLIVVGALIFILLNKTPEEKKIDIPISEEPIQNVEGSFDPEKPIAAKFSKIENNTLFVEFFNYSDKSIQSCNLKVYFLDENKKILSEETCQAKRPSGHLLSSLKKAVIPLDVKVPESAKTASFILFDYSVQKNNF